MIYNICMICSIRCTVHNIQFIKYRIECNKYGTIQYVERKGKITWISKNPNWRNKMIKGSEEAIESWLGRNLVRRRWKLLCGDCMAYVASVMCIYNDSHLSISVHLYLFFCISVVYWCLSVRLDVGLKFRAKGGWRGGRDDWPPWCQPLGTHPAVMDVGTRLPSEAGEGCALRHRYAHLAYWRSSLCRHSGPRYHHLPSETRPGTGCQAANNWIHSKRALHSLCLCWGLKPSLSFTCVKLLCSI